MKSGLRFVCFFLAFTVEVKVKAVDLSEKNSTEMPHAVQTQKTHFNDTRKKKFNSEDFNNPKNIIQEPQNCLLESSECAVKCEDGRFQLRAGESKVMAQKNSILKRYGYNKVELIRGVALLDAAEDFYLTSAFGYAFVPKGGKTLIFKKGGRFHFYPIVEDIKLFPKKGDELFLPVGFRNWLGPVMSKGYTEVGVPHAANLETLMDHWGRLTLLKYTAFREPLEEYRLNWIEAIRKSSFLHKGMIQRRIASSRERERRRLEYLRKLRQQQRAVEEMYKRKNLYYTNPENF